MDHSQTRGGRASATAPVTTSLVASAVERLARAMVGLPDEAMDRPWAWRMYDEEGLRFALLMTQHELRDLAALLAAARDRAGKAPGESARIRAQYQDAYRDLTGVLHSVGEAELDREPAAGQWSVRAALDHMVEVIHGFSAVVDLAMDAHERGDALREPSDEEFRKAKARPEGLVTGDHRKVANGLFVAHRRALGAMARVRDEMLDSPALFWDGEMPLRFRLHRFEAHLRQHTVQIDKTLLAIGHPPTEAERLVWLVHRALGDVEAAFAPGVVDEAVREVAAAIDERARSVGSA